MMGSQWNYADFTQPGEDEIAGKTAFTVAESPYDRFVSQEALPMYRGGGVHDVRELDLKPWARLGGRGAFLQLDGTDGKWGMYVVEIPGAGSLEPERHIYEEMLYVVEGNGTTEVWADDGSSAPATFEWQAGSMFAIPLNARHRLVNATDKRALLIAGTTAPVAINLFGNDEFIFNNPFNFRERYAGQQDYFAEKLDLQTDPIRGRAMVEASFLPDIAGCDLPLDNQRSPGYRRIQPHMAGNDFSLFIGEHEIGRYSKAHYHESGAILICIGGQGYSLNWPRDVGPRPWESGQEDQVQRQEYVAGGMVAAAPGGGDWFHQHFGTGRRPLRFLAMLGRSRATGLRPGHAGQKLTISNLDIERGGHSIGYASEDPYIRREYEDALRRDGMESRMPPEIYA